MKSTIDIEALKDKIKKLDRYNVETEYSYLNPDDAWGMMGRNKKGEYIKFSDIMELIKK